MSLNGLSTVAVPTGRFSIIFKSFIISGRIPEYVLEVFISLNSSCRLGADSRFFKRNKLFFSIIIALLKSAHSVINLFAFKGYSQFQLSWH